MEALLSHMLVCEYTRTHRSPLSTCRESRGPQDGRSSLGEEEEEDQGRALRLAVRAKGMLWGLAADSVHYRHQKEEMLNSQGL